MQDRRITGPDGAPAVRIRVRHHPLPGPEVALHGQAPSAGADRLYLNFSHGGAVHTAEFTMEAAMVESSTGPSTSGGAPHPGGGH